MSKAASPTHVERHQDESDDFSQKLNLSLSSHSRLAWNLLASRQGPQSRNLTSEREESAEGFSAANNLHANVSFNDSINENEAEEDQRSLFEASAETRYTEEDAHPKMLNTSGAEKKLKSRFQRARGAQTWRGADIRSSTLPTVLPTKSLEEEEIALTNEIQNLMKDLRRSVPDSQSKEIHPQNKKEHEVHAPKFSSTSHALEPRAAVPTVAAGSSLNAASKRNNKSEEKKETHSFSRKNETDTQEANTRSLISLAYDSDHLSSPESLREQPSPNENVNDKHTQRVEQDLQLADLQLTVKSLQNKLNSLQGDSSGASTFELYERDIDMLNEQLSQTQNTLVKALLPHYRLPSPPSQQDLPGSSPLIHSSVKGEGRRNASHAGEQLWKSSLRNLAFESSSKKSTSIAASKKSSPASHTAASYKTASAPQGQFHADIGLKLLAGQLKRTQIECEQLKKKERRFDRNEAFLNDVLSKLKHKPRMFTTCRELDEALQEIDLLKRNALDDSAAWKETKRHKKHNEELISRIKVLEARCRNTDMLKNISNIYSEIGGGDKRDKEKNIKNSSANRREKISIVDDCEETLEDLILIDRVLKAHEQSLGPDRTLRGATKESQAAKQAVRKIRTAFVSAHKQRLKAVSNENAMVELLFKIKEQHKIDI